MKHQPRVVLAAALLGAWCNTASSMVISDTTELSLISRFETAVFIEQADDPMLDMPDDRLHKLSLSLLPELSWEGERMSFYGQLRIELDAIDALSPGEAGHKHASSASRIYSPSNHAEIELREGYFSWINGDQYWKFGKQQVVWGKSDGLKVLDVVNPQRYREFILEPYEQSRIPLWTLLVEQRLSWADIQLLWIPDTTYHDIPTNGAFAINPALNVALPATLERDSERPNHLIEDSDYGIRFSGFTKGWDWSLNYFYHFSDTPVLDKRLVENDGTVHIQLTPQYRRSHLIGGSFSNAFGDFTVRGEYAYSTHRWLDRRNAPTDFELVSKPESKSVLGVDWLGLSNTLLSAQLFNTFIHQYTPSIVSSRSTTQVTLLVKQDYWHQTLRSQISLITDLDEKDGLAQAKLAYNVNDQLTVEVNAAVFYGNQHGLFGQFRTNDRIAFVLEHTL